MPHSIRLHGPWQWTVCPAADGPDLDEACQAFATAGLPVDDVVRVPTERAQSSGDETAATVCLQRRFHAPTGLESGDRLRLEFRSQPSVAAAWLNGRRLPLHRNAEATWVDVSGALAPDNRLLLVLPVEGGQWSMDWCALQIG